MSFLCDTLADSVTNRYSSSEGPWHGNKFFCSISTMNLQFAAFLGSTPLYYELAKGKDILDKIKMRRKKKPHAHGTVGKLAHNAGDNFSKEPPGNKWCTSLGWPLTGTHQFGDCDSKII